MTERLAVITITILAVISHGPDFAMVSRNSLMLSRRAGMLTAFGSGLGVLIHLSCTLHDILALRITMFFVMQTWQRNRNHID